MLLLCGLQARAGLDAVESSTVFAPPIPLPYLISIEREAGPSCDVWPRRWAASQSSRAARRRRGGEEEGGEEAERSARQSRVYCTLTAGGLDMEGSTAEEYKEKLLWTVKREVGSCFFFFGFIIFVFINLIFPDNISTVSHDVLH